MDNKDLLVCCNSLQESHLREAKLQEIVCYLEDCFVLIRESIQNDQGLDVVDDIAAKALSQRSHKII